MRPSIAMDTSGGFCGTCWCWRVSPSCWRPRSEHQLGSRGVSTWPSASSWPCCCLWPSCVSGLVAWLIALTILARVFFLLSSRNVRFHICTEACSDREGYVAIFSPTYFLGEGETLTKKIARTGCFLGGFLAMLVYVYTWDSLIIHHCTLGFLSKISLGVIYYYGGP